MPFPVADGASSSLSIDATKASIEHAVVRFAVFFLSLPIVILAVNVTQRSVIFVVKNVHFKPSRVSPFQGFKNKFGPSGIFEFLKNLTKATLFCWMLCLSIRNNLENFPLLVNLNQYVGMYVIFEIVKDLLLAVVAVSVCILVLDYAWQRHTFLKKNMMSLQEVKDEFRESEGDPHFKSARRQRAIEVSSQHMLAAVPDADVVIVNPTHYSVALKWTIGVGNAPEIVALGVDNVALRIKNVAIESAVPIFEDIPTARALVSSHSVGDEITPEHYAAVAAAIRFSQKPNGAVY